MTTPDLSAEARRAKVDRDRLDAAIDHVAARMVAVADDADMTLRIVGALPERTSRLRWLIPQLAAIGVIAIAAIVWTMRGNTAPAIATLPAATIAPMTGLVNAVAADEPGTAFRTLPREPLARPGTMEPAVMTSSDHERSLPAIAAMRPLDFDSLAPVSLPEDAPLTLEPLAIADLPLTTDNFSPR